MRIPIAIPFFTPAREYLQYQTEFNQGFQEVLTSGALILGPEVEAFEKELAHFCGTRYAIALNSGTDALVLGLKALGVGPGDEVLTTPFSFIASSHCILRLGATPIYVDIDPVTFNLNVNQLESKITSKTKAILPVHLFLQCTPMDTILKLAQKHKIKILEDAAEAFGMYYEGKHAGSLGDMGVLSFYPTKTLGAFGDSGALIFQKEEYLLRLKALRNHGSLDKETFTEVGWNSRMDGLQGKMLRLKLSRIQKAIQRRNEIGHLYDQGLKGIPQVDYCRVPDPKNKPVYYVYTIRAQNRDGLAAYLKSQGIGYSIYYSKPIHLQPPYQFLGHKEGSFPESEKACKEVLALPIFPELTDSEVSQVCDAIRNFYQKKA
ncbi:MAG: DegT/DnrJ/EryC1/StrS family aminotransferase [Planctomycetota bacterium]